MRRVRGIGRGVTGLAIAASMAIAAWGAGQAWGTQQARARLARTLNGTETVHLRLVRQNETLLYEEGPTTGALAGRMQAALTVGAVFTGRFTIRTRAGTITGRGRATPHGFGRYQSFAGTLTVIGGTGRYAHVHGSTRLFGTFDRRTFSVILKTSGRLSY